MYIKLIDLPHDAVGIFQDRPNRFLGIVDIIDSKTGKVTSKGVKAHVHDPGRLKEILYPGNKVLMKKPSQKSMITRKTSWDIIAGLVGNQWILVHSGYHRKISEAILKNHKISPFGKLKSYTPEVRFGHSRLDFLLTKKTGKNIYVEVKGCTLTIDDRALFPDAPTERGSRHMESLIDARKSGFEAALLILVFRADSRCFAPNEETDKKFAEIFKKAIRNGVSVYPLVLCYEKGKIYFQKAIPVCQDFI